MLLAALVTLIYAGACLGAGLLVLRALAGRGAVALAGPGVPVVASGLIVGQAVVAALLTVVALIGWLWPAVIAVGLAALVAAAARPMWTAARGALLGARDTLAWLRAEPAALRLTAVLLAVLVAGLGLAAAVRPPVGDAEAFYVVYGRLIAARGTLEPMPGLYAGFSSIGLMGELHFAALIALSGVAAAKLFVWPLALAAAAVLAAICRAVGVGRRGQLFALAMLFTTTAFTHHIHDGKVDLFAAALGLTAVYWVLAGGGAPARPGIALAGLSAGFAAVAKFSYIPSLLPALVVLLAWRERRVHGGGWRALRALTVSLTVLGLWALVATLPHLLKNAVLFDAPLAPFVGGPQDKGWLRQVWFPAEVTRRIVLTYPLALVFGRYPMQAGNLSYLLLAFLPLAWWLPRPARWGTSPLAAVTLAGLIGTALWVALRPSVIAPRYILATLLLLYPLVARSVEHALAVEPRPRWLRAGIVASTLAAFLVFSYPLFPMARQMVSALQGTSADPCALASPYCGPLRALDAVAAPGDRVYYAGYYTYWLRDDLLQCRDSYREAGWMRLLEGPGLTWEALAEGGFRWLVVELASHAAEYQALSASAPPPGVEVRESVRTAEVLVLRLDDHAGPKAPACREAPPGTWRVEGPS